MGHDLLQNELIVATTLLNKKGYIAKPFRKQRGCIKLVTKQNRCIMEAYCKIGLLDSGSALQNRIGWDGGDRGVERPRAAPRILMLF
jgi:hypothetical protein